MRICAVIWILLTILDKEVFVFRDRDLIKPRSLRIVVQKVIHPQTCGITGYAYWLFQPRTILLYALSWAGT